MNITVQSSGKAILYSGPNCGFCGRLLPEHGTCKCGVWKRVKIDSPCYLIETTAECHRLVNTDGYWSEQYKQMKEEKAEAAEKGSIALGLATKIINREI